MDVTGALFDAEVLEASVKLPMLVDFWAPWCAPCRALTPVLEKLEREYGGRFKLAKVNSDDNRELAAAFGVRSIPDVVAFRNRKPAAHFLGALPESEVRAFIDRLLPSPAEEKIALAERLIEEGRPGEAERLLSEVPPNIDWDAKVETLRAAIAFARSTGNEAELKGRLAANPKDCDARLALARLYAGARCYREAMDELLRIVRSDKDWRDGEARKQLLHIFKLAEGEPALVSEYRRMLATALY